MAKGYSKSQERKYALAKLGGPLSRRSRSRCELCSDGGVGLHPTEVPPKPDDPDPDRTLLLCEPCADGVRGGRIDDARWRFLEEVVWSETPVVQVGAIRILRRLAKGGALWPTATLEVLYLSPEVEAWLESS